MKGNTGRTLIRPVLASDFPLWLPLWDGYNVPQDRQDTNRTQ
jgi:hypothetical protein